jgi:hypothetical protein
MLRAARHYLEAPAGRLREEALTVQTKALEGNPAGTILACASHGSSAFRIPHSAFRIPPTHYGGICNRPLIGSVIVVEQIMQKATVPLLLARPEVTTLTATR